MKNKKGFTLVELLAVIVVLALIMVVTIPNILSTLSRTKQQGFIEFGQKALYSAQKTYLTEKNFKDRISNEGVYNITSDIGLGDTDKYEGYVVVRNCSGKDEFILFVNNGEYQLVNYNVNDHIKYEDALEEYDADTFPTSFEDYKMCGEVDDNTLFKRIKLLASTDPIDFKIRSGNTTTPTNGVYITNNTEGGVPVYYYRGNVDNNLIFNGMCWKIMHTTETGGVKLLYNGLPTNGTCVATGTATQIGTAKFNSNVFYNSLIGYMYGNLNATDYSDAHANVTNSLIKTNIDAWFSSNFNSTTTSMLEDTPFCNDRSVVAYDSTKQAITYVSTLKGYGTEKSIFASSNRSSYFSKTPDPDLRCQNQNDKFTVNAANGNGALTYPVGLITTDEAILAGLNTQAGAQFDYKDTNSYIISGEDFWTLTPLVKQSYANNSYIVGDGSFYYGMVSLSKGVRPVISLKAGTNVQSGDGTKTTPFVIS